MKKEENVNNKIGNDFLSIDSSKQQWKNTKPKECKSKNSKKKPKIYNYNKKIDKNKRNNEEKSNLN